MGSGLLIYLVSRNVRADRLRELLPLLNSEPDSSPLYMMAAFCDHKGRSSPYSEEEQSQLAELMAVLPRPVGHLANRLVTVHGETTHHSPYSIGLTHPPSRSLLSLSSSSDRRKREVREASLGCRTRAGVHA